MVKNNYNIIGVMSGTSLDGIDVIQASFTFDGFWSYSIVCAETIRYPLEWIKILTDLVSFSSNELKKIDEDYTIYLANIIKEFIFKNDIKNVDAVCSHGHTALHQPELKLTHQIGNLPKLTGLINEMVVCDFRVQDVMLGGQGAPLVPIGDRLLFPEYDFCLNLGGFANISTENDDQRIAYDICPVNIVLNHYVKSLSLDYDDEGHLAKSGDIHTDLLKKLNGLEFYTEPYPKSLGLEWVKKEVFTLIDSFELETKDILRTFVEHIAIQIASEINKKNQVKVLATGGGVYNTYLLKRLNYYSKNEIIMPSNEILEFKEALIFGLLGVLRLRNEVNCLKSVTGALRDHSSGKIYLP